MYRSTLSWPRHKLEVNGQLHAPTALPPGERARGTHWIGGWVDETKKRELLTLPGLEFQPLHRFAFPTALSQLMH
jgi:hypothetical protein